MTLREPADYGAEFSSSHLRTTLGHMNAEQAETLKPLIVVVAS